jgi:hypothetical protein
MAGGRTNESDVQPFKMTSAITYPGTLLKVHTVAGEMEICGAGDEPAGYSFSTTKNPITGVAEAAVTRGVVALINGQEAEILVLPANVEINVGDDVETTAGGTVDKLAAGGWVVGKALEKILINAGVGKHIRIRVDKHWVAP